MDHWSLKTELAVVFTLLGLIVLGVLTGVIDLQSLGRGNMENGIVVPMNGSESR